MKTEYFYELLEYLNKGLLTPKEMIKLLAEKMYSDRDYILKLQQELIILKVVLVATVIIAVLLFITCQNVATALIGGI